jgi:hypothetical protein
VDCASVSIVRDAITVVALFFSNLDGEEHAAGDPRVDGVH